MFPRSHLETGFDENLYHLGDIEYWFRIVKNRSYFYLNELLCNFRTHRESTTSKNAKGLRFALDMVRLGRQYRTYLDQMGITKEAYSQMVEEVTATHVRFLFRHKRITLEDLLAVEHKSPESLADDLASFKEISSIRFLLPVKLWKENVP